MVPYLSYNEAEIMERLERLPADLRVSFAAACAQRLLPAYAEYSKEIGDPPNGLNELAGHLWEGLEQGHHSLNEGQEADACMSLMPDDADDELHIYAQDAVAALTYAFRARISGDSQEAAWAARRAYEAFDQFAIKRTQIDLADAMAEQTILTNPIVQDELRRQNRDLDDLLLAAASVAQEERLLVVRALRSRAASEGAQISWRS